MSGKIYHPEEKHPEPYQQDLGPDASKGLNYGQEGAEIPKRTAVDIKALHEFLPDFSPDELREMQVLQEGARLETKAAYINLAAEHPHEFQAMGSEDVGSNDFYLAKKDMPYELWNKLLDRFKPSNPR
jgi:hypothetical protein